MKKNLEYLFVLVFMFFLGITSTSAIEITSNNIPNNSYVIGKHIFTDSTVLTTRHIMLAAKTIEGDTIDDMIIYYKTPRGKWIDGLSGETLNVPASFEVYKQDLVDLCLDTPSIKNIKYIEHNIANPVTYTTGDYDGIFGTITYKLNLDSNIGDGFEIYSSSTENGDYTLLKTVNQYTDSSNFAVNDGVQTYIKVRAFKTVNNEKIYSEYSDSLLIDQSVFKNESANISDMSYDTDTHKIKITTLNNVTNGDGLAIFVSDTLDGDYTLLKEDSYDNVLSFVLNDYNSSDKKYFTIYAYKDVDNTRVYSMDEISGVITESINITGKEYVGKTSDDEVVYEIKLDKKIGDYAEMYMYSKIGGQATYVKTIYSSDIIDDFAVNIPNNTIKYVKIIPGLSYGSGGGEIFDEMGQTIEIDQSNSSTAPKINNMSYYYDYSDNSNYISFYAINFTGDGVNVYESDSEDGTFTLLVEGLTKPQYSQDNLFSFMFNNSTESTVKYFKIEAYKDLTNNVRQFSPLSEAQGQLVSNVSISSVKYLGITDDNKVNYKIILDKKVGDGVNIKVIDADTTEYNTYIDRTISDYSNEDDFIIELENGKDYIIMASAYDLVNSSEKTTKYTQSESSGYNLLLSYLNDKVSIVDSSYDNASNVITLNLDKKVGDGYVVFASNLDGDTYTKVAEGEYPDTLNVKISNTFLTSDVKFRVMAYKDSGDTRNFSELSETYVFSADTAEIESKTMDGFADGGNTIVYQLTVNNIPTSASGIEIYSSDSINGSYSFVNSYTSSDYNYIKVEIPNGKTLYYKVRPYYTTDNVVLYGNTKLYGKYSEPFEINQTKLNSTTEIIGVNNNSVDKTMSFTISEEIGSGLYLCVSNAYDGEYTMDFNGLFDDFYRYVYNYTNNTNELVYFKARSYSSSGASWLFSDFSEPYGVFIDNDITIDKTLVSENDTTATYKITVNKELGDGVLIYTSSTEGNNETLLNTTDGYSTEKDFYVTITKGVTQYITVQAYKDNTAKTNRVVSYLSNSLELS